MNKNGKILFNMNINNINNYAFNKNKNETEKLRLFRKNMCRSINKNIVIKKNNIPTIENTILFIGISELNIGKIIVLNQLLKSNLNSIIGIDNKYYKNIEEFNNHILKYSDYITRILDNNIDKFTNCSKTMLDNNSLIKKYGDKIKNFNGRWENNPSKLGSLEWFNNSNYEYFWYIEDDIFCKNYDLFINKYNNNNSDLICSIDNNLPEWYNNSWRVGDKCHGLELAHLYISRYSKQYSNYFFNFLKETKTTSHHEIFIPYILHYYHLSFFKLKDEHKKTLLINGGNTKFFNISDNNVNNINSEIFHPFKIK